MSIILQPRSIQSFLSHILFRSQFSDDQPTAVDEAIELVRSPDKLTENSVASLSPLMATLTTYRKMQQEICQAQQKQVSIARISRKSAGCSMKRSILQAGSLPGTAKKQLDAAQMGQHCKMQQEVFQVQHTEFSTIRCS